MSRQVGSPKGAKAKADKYFSLIVRSRGACESCGGTANLQTAHIISRRYSHTRCDERNAFCMDTKCHMYFTDHPVEFAEFVLHHCPDYHALWKLSIQTGKVDWTVVAADLKARWDAIEDAA